MNEDVLKSLRNNINEKLIIGALVFSPFTKLRIGFVGVTEVLLLILFINVLFDKTNLVSLKAENNFIFIKFWSVYIFLSIVGTFYNYVILNHQSGTITSFLIDFSSYVMVFIVIFSMEVLIFNSRINIWSILKKTYIYLSILLLVLYITSFFVGSIFGLPLKYYQFFSPLSNNIHHVAMSIVPLPFIGLKLYKMSENFFSEISYILLIISNIVIANSTGALKVVLGFVASLIIFLLFSVLSKIKERKMKLLSIFFIFIILFGVIAIFYEPILRISADFFVEEDIGNGRQLLWSDAMKKVFQSPFIGYGAGAHANYISNFYSDAHQTLLTIGLQTGIFGMVLYIILNFIIIKQIYKNPYLLSSYIGILIYALGGDILRRLPMWLFLIMYYYAASNIRKFKI